MSAPKEAGCKFRIPFSPQWCKVVNDMARERKRRKRSGEESSVRASISFPPDIYETLDEIAQQRKVSLAWVVREAVEKYIADMWPLFARTQQ
jgi:hypothetical protein